MSFEIDIIKALQNGRNMFFDTFFKIFSMFATIYMVFIIAFILFLCKKRWPAFWFLVLEGVGYVVGFVMKHIIARTRPYLTTTEIVGIVPEDSYSMPSGHSLCAIIMAIFVVYIFWDNKKTWQRALMVTGGVCFTVLMGISRMYLGVHYLTDLVVGFALGYCVCMVAYWLRNPVARLANVILDKIGLPKWKMNVPPPMKIYDDVQTSTIQGEVVETKKQEVKKDSEEK